MPPGGLGRTGPESPKVTRGFGVGSDNYSGHLGSTGLASSVEEDVELFVPSFQTEYNSIQVGQDRKNHWDRDVIRFEPDVWRDRFIDIEMEGYPIVVDGLMYFVHDGSIHSYDVGIRDGDGEIVDSNQLPDGDDNVVGTLTYIEERDEIIVTIRDEDVDDYIHFIDRESLDVLDTWRPDGDGAYEVYDDFDDEYYETDYDSNVRAPVTDGRYVATVDWRLNDHLRDAPTIIRSYSRMVYGYDRESEEQIYENWYRYWVDDEDGLSFTLTDTRPHISYSDVSEDVGYSVQSASSAGDENYGSGGFYAFDIETGDFTETYAVSSGGNGGYINGYMAHAPGGDTHWVLTLGDNGGYRIVYDSGEGSFDNTEEATEGTRLFYNEQTDYSFAYRESPDIEAFSFDSALGGSIDKVWTKELEIESAWSCRDHFYYLTVNGELGLAIADDGTVRWEIEEPEDVDFTPTTYISETEREDQGMGRTTQESMIIGDEIVLVRSEYEDQVGYMPLLDARIVEQEEEEEE